MKLLVKATCNRMLKYNIVRFEVFTAGTVMIAVFWDIETNVRFEVFTAVTMYNGVFWDVSRATRRNISQDTILYRNKVRTSQKTHYVSAAEHSRLMLCKI
jgi:hypothetical protein